MHSFRTSMAQRRLAWALLALLAPPAAATADLKFITVDQGTSARKADKKLEELLEQRLEAQLDPKSYDYEKAIRVLADWRRDQDGDYLARLTPYVYIAAEILGADLEILGTYHSQATDQETYHAYFVVHRESFPGIAPEDLERRHLLDWLREGDRPRFVYHSRFSTSSYFLPSLFLRANRIFHMAEANERMAAIRSEVLDETHRSSTELVLRVARGEADFAAVWDGTKSKFDPGGALEDVGRQVAFIRLPTRLPNDLLVSSGSLDDAVKKTIRNALSGSGDAPGLKIGIDDFAYWVDVNAAPDAREALGDLRWLARQAPAPVTVRIADAEGAFTGDWILDAARQAVRLSGTELVLYDPSFHRRVDYEWTLELIREGYLELTSEIPDTGLRQTFNVSFRPGDREGLAGRLDRTIHSRLHRLRYLWPYDRKHPLVIRDVVFSLPPRSPVLVQEIRWQDPQRNDYSTGASYEARVRDSDDYKFTLLDEDAARLTRDSEAAFDPMSNHALRVILVRPEEPRTMFRVFTSVFYGMLAASVLGTVAALRRREV